MPKNKKKTKPSESRDLLNSPMPPLAINFFDTDEERNTKATKHFTEEFLRLLAVSIELKVDLKSKNFWFDLSLALARKHEPSFQEKKQKGRSRKWNAFNKGLLNIEVERLQAEGHPRDTACNMLSSKEPWKTFLERKHGAGISPDPQEAIRRQLYGGTSEIMGVFLKRVFLEYQATIG